MNGQSTNTPADEANTPVGERLKRERERKNLSIKQAADSLNLDPPSIEALEEGRFTALGPPVYVKGHLQKYATLLGLDCAALVSAYETQQEAGPALTPLSLSMRMVQPRRWKFVVLAVLVVAIGATAAVFWFTQR